MKSVRCQCAGAPGVCSTSRMRLWLNRMLDMSHLVQVRGAVHREEQRGLLEVSTHLASMHSGWCQGKGGSSQCQTSAVQPACTAAHLTTAQKLGQPLGFSGSPRAIHRKLGPWGRKRREGGKEWGGDLKQQPARHSTRQPHWHTAGGRPSCFFRAPPACNLLEACLRRKLTDTLGAHLDAAVASPLRPCTERDACSSSQQRSTRHTPDSDARDVTAAQPAQPTMSAHACPSTPCP